MLTKNFKLLFTAYTKSQSWSLYNLIYSTNNYNIVNTEGKSLRELSNEGIFLPTDSLYYNYYLNAPSNDDKEVLSNNKGAGTTILFGTGTTPPSVDDFKLDSIIENIEIINTNVNGNGGIWLCSRTIRNNNNDVVSISEVGLYSAPTNSNYNFRYLLAREVLQEPVVMQPGEVYTFTFTIG